MIEFIERNECEFLSAPTDEAVSIMFALASGELGEGEFVSWVGEHLRCP